MYLKCKKNNNLLKLRPPTVQNKMVENEPIVNKLINCKSNKSTKNNLFAYVYRPTAYYCRI
jgi:hypothetical protein